MEIKIEVLVTILIVIVGYITQYFTVINKIQNRLGALETKTDLFWKTIESNVVNLLKSYPTYIDKDVLLDKMLHGELTYDEACVLRTILGEEFRMKTRDENPVVYVLALSRLSQLIFELKPICKHKKWKLF